MNLNLLLSQKFTELYTLTATYNMRLHRPSIISLNPYIDNSDPFNISSGNPYLDPQMLHSIAIQIFFSVGRLFAAVGANGSYTSNMILQYATV
jgi:hypothetical protein